MSFTSNIEMVVKAVAAGLMQGRNDGSFGSYQNATRAEAAVVISRFMGGMR